MNDKPFVLYYKLENSKQGMVGLKRWVRSNIRTLVECIGHFGTSRPYTLTLL